jgi:hypothetical protein
MCRARMAVAAAAAAAVLLLACCTAGTHAAFFETIDGGELQLPGRHAPNCLPAHTAGADGWQPGP